MAENELHELNRLSEIAPDCESAQVEPAQAPAENVKLRTLFLPVLLITTGAVLMVLFCSFDGFIPVFFPILGLGSAITSAVLIYRYKLDTSKYFPVKMILFALTAAAIAVYLSGKYFSLIMLGAAVVGELAFALCQKTDGKTKLCLILSSGVWGFIGSVLDFWLYFSVY